MKTFWKDESGVANLAAKPIIIISIISLILLSGFGIYKLVTKNDKEDIKVSVVETEKKDNEKTKYSVFDETLHMTIQNDLHNEALGKVVNGYDFKGGYYLVLTRKDDKTYSQEFPGDRVLWVKEKNGKVVKDDLTGRGGNSGDYLVSIITKKDDENNPYLKYNGRIYFVYYERSGLAERGNNQKGFVYEVMSDGKIKKVFETNGVFGGIKETKDNELLILDKQYLEDRGMFPTSLKPYELSYTKIEHDGVKVIKKEIKEPAKEKMEELDFGEEFTEGKIEDESEKK